MQNTFSSEIGYRLLTRAELDPDLEKKLRIVLLSQKPIELIVHQVKNLLRSCLSKPHGNILIERLTAMLDEDPSLHDISQLQRALIFDSWPSAHIDSKVVPTWKNPNVRNQRNPNALSAKIESEIDDVRMSHQTVFPAVIELAGYLDRYSGVVERETSELAIRLVNLAALFSERYDVPSLTKLMIAFDKISPHIEETFAFFAQDCLYKQLSEKTKDGIAGADLMRVFEALSFTAGSYITGHQDEDIIFEDNHLSLSDLNREDKESTDTLALLDYCLDQLVNSPDIFNDNNAPRILKCLCDLQCAGFNLNPAIAAKLIPESFPRTHHDAIIVTRSGYIFEEALSEEQRENLLKLEKELKRCFDETQRGKISVSNSERDAQVYLQQNYSHLPLQFNAWIDGFERDCFVDFPYGLKVNFEIDGSEFHRFKARKDAMMNYISKKKGIIVVRIEKRKGLQSRKESIQETQDVIDHYLHYFKEEN